MYCPRCAAQNLDDAKYCRACGADISLVPQALAGEPAKKLDANEGGWRSSRDRESPSIERAFVALFMGVAFVIIALASSMSGSERNNWWFYMLIPAFLFLGKGIGSLVRLNEDRKRAAPATLAPDTTLLDRPRRASALPPLDTDELVATPPSVTEATTRHLGVPVERKPRDV